MEVERAVVMMMLMDIVTYWGDINKMVEEGGKIDAGGSFQQQKTMALSKPHCRDLLGGYNGN
jgi:hypothetical protein